MHVHVVRAVLVLLVATFVGGQASAITLADLDAGGSISTADGSLTFENWSVDIPGTTASGDPNFFANLDLTLFDVQIDVDGLTLTVLETSGPLAAFGGGVGELNITFDVVADTSLIQGVSGVGLMMTGTAIGTGALAQIDETVVSSEGTFTMTASREAGGAQTPQTFVAFDEAQTNLTITKEILLDASEPGALVAQISEFEQSFEVAPIPEPSAAILFGLGALVVRGSLRRRS